MLEKPDKIRIALISGAVIGLISALPGVNLINCCCCAGVILGGVLSMYLYKEEYVEAMPPMGAFDAVILGVMSGVAGAFISTVLGVLIHLIFGSVEEEFVRSIFDKVLERLGESGAFTGDMIDQMRQQFEEAIRDSGKTSGILGGLFMRLIIYPLFAILGALIGYAVFKPKQTPEVPTPH